MSAARVLAVLGLATGVAAAIAFGPFENAALADGLSSKAAADPSSSTIGEAGADEATSPPFDSQAERAKWTMAVLDHIFVEEARDDEWASVRETEIHEASAKERLVGVGSIDAECRASMCRVVLSLDPTRARRTLHALIVTPPLNTSGFHGIDPDDHRKIRLFVSREGTALIDHPALVDALRSRRD